MGITNEDIQLFVSGANFVNSNDVAASDIDETGKVFNASTDPDVYTPVPQTPDIDFAEMIQALTQEYLTSGPAAYAELVEEHRMQFVIACALNETLKRIVLIGLEMGLNEGNDACANELGALYYTGDIVEQDYAKAAEFYEIAAKGGNVQAIINLGYIYEYGRIGAPDYAKAYMYYSFAAATTDNSEALYKMGDLYSRGKGVEESKSAAVSLWQKSFDNAPDIEIKAQPAFRLAEVFLSPEKSAQLGIESDPMLALQLFQTAEIGLRISVSKGLTYYKKRLQEAIEGQQKARAILDDLV